VKWLEGLMEHLKIDDELKQELLSKLGVEGFEEMMEMNEFFLNFIYPTLEITQQSLIMKPDINPIEAMRLMFLAGASTYRTLLEAVGVDVALAEKKVTETLGKE
jgi:hypothetical protein